METDKTSDVWKTFLDNLKIVLQQIQEGEGRATAPDDFSFPAYWHEMEDAFRALSHEATKLSLAYSKPPAPSDEECESLVASSHRTILVLAHLYNNLPKSAGLTLRKSIKTSVKQLLEGIHSLAETIHTYSSGTSKQLQCTGIVWEERDRFATLPKDNKTAVVQVIDRNCPLLEDAHTELTEALDCNEDDDGLDEFLGLSNTISQNDHHWTDNDKTVIQYCLGLIKCSKSVLKKSKSAINTNGNCDSEVSVSQLDDISDRVERLSPVVDELASCVYPPLRASVVQQKALDVEQANKDLLEFLRHSHVTGEDDKKWIDFLLKANTHNMAKLNSALSAT